MDRVNRSLLVASFLIAIPSALLMATLVTGTTPESSTTDSNVGGVALANGDGRENEGVIQQVVGKQPVARKTRPGLFQVLAGSKPKGNQDHRHANMPKSEPKGLLDSIFDGRSNTTAHNHGSSNSGRSSHSHSSNSVHSSHAHANHSGSTTRSPSDVDWNGVPYHRADSHSLSQVPAPIRDPNPASTSRLTTSPRTTRGGTRIIRGGSNRTIPAATASVRRSTGPTLAKRPARPVPPPTLRESAPVERSLTDFSTTSSSRRRGRQTLVPLDPSEVAAASKAKRPTVSELEGDDVGLIPRVVREEETVAAKTKADAELPSKPTDSQKLANQDSATKSKRRPSTKSATKSATKPTPQSDVAVKRDASPQVEPKSSADVAKTGVAKTDVAQATTPSNPPQYTTPVDPSKQAVPMIQVPASQVPAQPYAASTPSPATTPGATLASPVSHRAGPPPTAFQPGQVASLPPAAPANPATGSAAAYPQYNAASTPVGSGVASNSGVASFRRPAATERLNVPAPTAIQPPTYPVGDPSAATAVPPQRMTTNGQPVESVTAAPASTTPAPAAQPTHEIAAVPMQPINGYAPRNVDAVRSGSVDRGDNFARAGRNNRNQMRDPASITKSGQTASTSELPGIRVATHGPSSIMIRQTNQYEIRVENRGSIDASGVLVRTLLPEWADVRGRNATRGDIDNQTQGSSERLVWTIDHLPAGAAETMFIRLTAARSGTYDLDVDWTLIPQKSVARVQVHEPRLDLTIEGPDEVVYGQSQTYKVRVLNPGDGTAPNVVFTLSPNSATPQTQRIGDIPPGKEAQFDVELTAQDLGDLKIHGLAAGDLELRAESAKTIRVASAKIEAVLSGPELKYQDTEAVYGLQLQNTGAATSERIVASLRIPNGTKYVGGIDGAVLQGNTLKWQINSLAPGAERSYQFRCNMSSTGEHLFAFECKGSAAGTADVSIATRVESIADLVLSVSDPAAPAPIGSDVTYEIVIRNRGSKEATDVRAVAQFSHGIEPQRIEGQSGEVVTGQVLFDPIPRIGAGQEVKMRVVAQADRAGHHRFRTEVRSGDTVLVAEEATHYMSPKSERVSRRSSDAASH